MKSKIIFVACLMVVALLSCKKKEEDPGPTQQINQGISAGSQILKKGTFTGYAHDLSGKSAILKEGNKHILRLTKYYMTPGPDVDVLLSKTASYSAGNVVKIADLNGGYTNSSINLSIPDGINWSEYPYVMVWCVQYSQNFGVAMLSNP